MRSLRTILPIFIFLLAALLNAQDFATIKRVTDGNTLVLSNDERVRLIGIDAPESRPNPRVKKQAGMEGKDEKTIIQMGKESTKLVKTLVKPGDEVKLEFDVEKRDRYGRLLAYVYLSDGRMLNER